MMKPKFIIGGIQKSGTTFLDNLVRNHPDIEMPERIFHSWIVTTNICPLLEFAYFVPAFLYLDEPALYCGHTITNIAIVHLCTEEVKMLSHTNYEDLVCERKLGKRTEVPVSGLSREWD